MLIQGKLLSFGDDLKEVFAIRREVFVGEQGLSEKIIYDELDATAIHVIVYEEKSSKKAVATGRIVYDGQNCEVGQIAVLKEHRRMKYGDFTVRMLINKAFSAGVEEVYINAPISTEAFFSKIGFQVIGENFIEFEIPHHKMVINVNNVARICNKNEM